MSNFSVLEKEISRLKKEQEELRRVMESEIRYREDKIRQCQEAMLYSYPEFFDEKVNKRFEWIRDFPSKKEVQYYEESGDLSHPLMDYGDFPVKELAELIKLLFSYQKQEEYKIVTCGYSNSYDSALFFLIGNEKSLADYISFQGTFQKEVSKEIKAILTKKIPNLIGLKALESNYNTLEVQWNIENLNRFNIFHNCLVNFSDYEGIQDTLSFPIHSSDKFLAEMLISIAIYKKNNGLIYQKNQEVRDLMDEHYQEIFKVLFGEPYVGNIQQMIHRDIPKTLRYIPKDRKN